MSAHVHLVRSVLMLAMLAAPVGVAAQTPTSAPVTRLTRDEAVALALRENPTLRAKGLEVRATQANEITAGLRPHPATAYSAEPLRGRETGPPYTTTGGQTIEVGG